MIVIAKPQLDESDAAAVAQTVLTGWLTQGPRVREFETRFAEYVGAPHACAVANCTTALHLALLAAGVGPGSEVITVSHSFIASSNAIRHCGGEPVFVDIDPLTFNIDPSQIEPAITARTRAILCVHQLGMPCDVNAIVEIGRRHNLPIIEDAACAIGSELLCGDDWQRVGRPHGDVACFSFHPRKIITTGEGGMLTTAHSDWDAKFRLWRQHGMSIPDLQRHEATKIEFEEYTSVGFNYRMTDMQGALGVSQMRKLPGIIAERRSIAERYRQLLSRIPHAFLPVEPNWARTTWQSFCVRLPPGLNQKKVMERMLSDGVATRRGVMCSHREKAYEGMSLRHLLPHSEAAQDNCILLPLFVGLSEVEQETVVEALSRACAS